MSLLGLSGVVALACTGLALAGVIRVGITDGGLDLGWGRQRRRPLRLEVREGILADACLLAIAVTTANLVVASRWVPGTEVTVPVVVTSFFVCLLLAKVAPRGTTYWLAVEAAGVAALYGFTAPHAAGPAAAFTGWIEGIRASVNLAALVSLAGGAWMVVAWGVFWVARHRNAPVALAPMGVVLAIQVLNDPTQPSMGALIVMWILLAATMLLRLQTATIRERWHEMADSQVWMSLASRGAIVVVALLVIAVLLPPLSTTDLSVQMFPGRDPNATGLGPENGARARDNSLPIPEFAQTGYSERVAPGGTLVRSSAVVLKVRSDFGRPVYWRGINLYNLAGGVWTVGRAAQRLQAEVGPNTALDDGSTAARETVRATVEPVGVPQSTIFWPGDPVSVGLVARVQGNGQVGQSAVQAAYASSPIAPGGSYNVVATQSVATEDELRRAGTAYPASVLQLTGVGSNPFFGPGYISPDVARLAVQVAGTGSVYDQVKAIETYLRTQERYQLKVNPPPGGTDAVQYFLFQSHTGYCEYFASAMGQMVRSLGIPVRLVSGYGPGQPATPQDQDSIFRRDLAAGGTFNVLRAADAHTWVEVYFPTYGWIPFEPTPDPIYPPLERGNTPAQPAPAAVPAAPPAVTRPLTNGSRPSAIPAPAALGGGVLALAVLAVLVLLLLARVAVGPVSAFEMTSAWRRLGWLGRRLGVRRQASDTPLDFSRRLASRVPDLAPEIVVLGEGMSRRLYRVGGSSAPDREREAAAWLEIRARLIGLLARGQRGVAGVRRGATARP